MGLRFRPSWLIQGPRDGGHHRLAFGGNKENCEERVSSKGAQSAEVSKMGQQRPLIIQASAAPLSPQESSLGKFQWHGRCERCESQVGVSGSQRKMEENGPWRPQGRLALSGRRETAGTFRGNRCQPWGEGDELARWVRCVCMRDRSAGCSSTLSGAAAGGLEM